MSNPWSWKKLWAVSLICFSCGSAVRAESSLDEARQQFLTGKYAEAAETFGELAETKPLEAALGQVRCQMAVGKYDEAKEALENAAKAHPEAADIPAMLGKLAMLRGDNESAGKWVEAAIKLDEQHPAAHWLKAELLRKAGQMEEADKAYEWFIDYYNAIAEFKDPESLHYVGLAASQFARWNRIHDQFGFIVNELYPDAITVDKNYWPAHLSSGMLFLEKYNEADAEADFQAAQKINPNSAEIHAAVARLALQNYELEKAKKSIDRSLEINPNLLEAHQLKADIELANFEPAKAEKILEQALKLCPTSESTLGRLAATRGCLDGLDKPIEGSRMGQLINEATKRNPHAGEFFESLAESLDTMRRYPEAASFFDKAVTVMPQLVAAYGKLGLVHMRMGEEKEARKILEKSYEVDFGSVRVKNSLEVLDVLDTYETLETDHFLIRYDPKHDKIQAKYVAKYLEEIYPKLCEQMGHFPKEKSLFEIFNRAKNTRGHGWFSARMVGLPHIHTIGACAGKMVAMVSPGDMDEKFNWARVVKHEFVHVINLQQTNFTIPHWFTEALAVYNEGYPRAQSWNEMLARRVPEGEIFDLDTINLGFIRPSNSEDWQMAYCQAELYAEFMVDKFGEDALAKMLAGYADNLDTPATIERAFGVSKDDFEKDYAAFVKKVVAGLTVSEVEETKSFAELQKAVEDEPENADLKAALARAYLQRKAYPKAGGLAEKALKIDPKNQGAIYVKARLQMLIGNRDGVVQMLEDALDREAPQTNLLKLLAGLKYKAEKYDEAAKLYELGRNEFPNDETWTKLLTRVHLKSDSKEKLRPLLESMARMDADDYTVRKKLAQMALDAKDFGAAVEWANQAIRIDVSDVDVHRMLAEALVENKDHKSAIEEFEVAVELAPRQLQLRFAMADACVQAGDREKAREVLQELLKLDPEYPGADVLLESLESE